jgi:hypothetical protein
MEAIDTLLTIAEVAVAFAGFATGWREEERPSRSM